MIDTKLAEGDEIYALVKRLFPICRSLTGNGVRETLSIIKETIPIELREIPSGTKAFDWEVPDEWNINDAYVKDSTGKKVIDFNKINLHVMGYSIPFEGWVSLQELNDHLYSLPDQPDAIPYVTSYYERRWGFCLSQNDRDKLQDSQYEVKIDATLEPGYMSFGELLIPGTTEKEILLSTYICHPSMCNNELSGLSVCTFLAKALMESTNRDYSYRFLFIPETIGSIYYISRNIKELIEKVIAGYVVTCVGDEGKFSYLYSRQENTLTDRITKHVLEHSVSDFNLYSYLDRGSDERQYCAPGIDLPVGSLMRTKYGRYPEYHTSLDNLNLVTAQDLEKSLNMFWKCFNALENNHFYRTTVLCEPQLGKRGLYPTLSTKSSAANVRTMMNLIAYCDGRHDLLEIAEKLDVPIWILYPIVEKLISHTLLEPVEPTF